MSIAEQIIELIESEEEATRAGELLELLKFMQKRKKPKTKAGVKSTVRPTKPSGIKLRSATMGMGRSL